METSPDHAEPTLLKEQNNGPASNGNEVTFPHSKCIRDGKEISSGIIHPIREDACNMKPSVSIYMYICCMHVYVYVCICMCMYVCVYVCMYICICMYTCMYMYVYVCICICMYVYMYEEQSNKSD